MPNWGAFQQQGFDLTEKEIAALERQTIQVYRDALADIERQLEKVYAKLAGISPEDGGYYNEMLKRDRLKTLLRDVSASYNAFSRRAGVIVANASRLGVTNNYYRQQYATAWGGAVTFGAIPDSLVELTVLGTKEAWNDYTKAIAKKFGENAFYQPQAGTLSSFLAGNRKAELDKIQKAITQGMIQGKSLTKMVNSIKDITGREVVKDGKKVVTGAKANATRIIRTETTRTMNAGAFANTKRLDSDGVDVLKEWMATLDDVTRDRHASLDGTRIKPDEYFRIGGDRALYPGEFNEARNNVNCRCTTADIIPGFEPDTRIGRNPVTGKNEVFSYKNYAQWAKDNGLGRMKSGRMVVKK